MVKVMVYVTTEDIKDTAYADEWDSTAHCAIARAIRRLVKDRTRLHVNYTSVWVAEGWNPLPNWVEEWQQRANPASSSYVNKTPDEIMFQIDVAECYLREDQFVEV